MRFQMIRLKIQSIASDLGYSIGQYLLMAIYNTIVDWQFEEMSDKMFKLECLMRICDIIKSHKKLENLMEVLDLKE